MNPVPHMGFYACTLIPIELEWWRKTNLHSTGLFFMLLLILLILGVYLAMSGAVEGVIWLVLIYMAFWLLSLAIGIILMVLYLAAIVAGICIAGAGLFLANAFIFGANRKGYISLFLLCLPVSAMIVALAMAGLTGSGFTSTETIHTAQPYWYFWTKDVVSYREIPTVWKECLGTSFWISLCIGAAFVTEFFVRNKSGKAK